MTEINYFRSVTHEKDNVLYVDPPPPEGWIDVCCSEHNYDVKLEDIGHVNRLYIGGRMCVPLSAVENIKEAKDKKYVQQRIREIVAVINGKRSIVRHTDKLGIHIKRSDVCRILGINNQQYIAMVKADVLPVMCKEEVVRERYAILRNHLLVNPSNRNKVLAACIVRPKEGGSLHRKPVYFYEAYQMYEKLVKAFDRKLKT